MKCCSKIGESLYVDPHNYMKWSWRIGASVCVIPLYSMKWGWRIVAFHLCSHNLMKQVCNIFSSGRGRSVFGARSQDVGCQCLGSFRAQGIRSYGIIYRLWAISDTNIMHEKSRYIPKGNLKLPYKFVGTICHTFTWQSFYIKCTWIFHHFCWESKCHFEIFICGS